MSQEPMIKLEENGTAPVLSYNVPEPTSYTGRHVIELELAPEWFTPKAREVPPPPPAQPPSSPGRPSIRDVVMMPEGSLLLARRVADAATVAAGASPSSPGGPNVALTRSVIATSDPPSLKIDDDQDAAIKSLAGYRLARYVDVAGNRAVRLLPPVPAQARPRLLLVEVYRLSSYLGTYGAGRVLKTLTLLPGEKTKISIKTYTKTSTESKQASSILDSFTKESADDFERSMSQEQSDKHAESENFEYHAEAEASASWGWGSAKVSGGVKGGSASAREEFSKNVSNATQKHSSKASAKRDVQVNTSYEVKEETGEETSIERTIENVNLSRTLNFIFRQMNQQFVTILHLVDVRLAFFNGYSQMAREMTLPEIDRMLDLYIEPAHRAEARNLILAQVRTVRDHTGAERAFVEKVDLGNGESYMRVKKDLVYDYTEPVTQQTIHFTGIPMAIEKYTMRTDGVIVESMLGQAESLDQYARDLQLLEVRRRTAEAEKLEAEANRARLIVSLAEAGTAEAAKVISSLLCPCGPTVSATTAAPPTPPPTPP